MEGVELRPGIVDKYPVPPHPLEYFKVDMAKFIRELVDLRPYGYESCYPDQTQLTTFQHWDARRVQKKCAEEGSEAA